MIVQACLNGARPKDYHRRLPVTVEAVVDDAAESVAAGAAEIHVHVRGPGGAESLEPEVVDVTLAALRSRLPGTLIGISTGAWIERDDDRRLAMIAGWGELPDYASVNLKERAAPAVIERLHRRGIGVEAGLTSVADAERLVRLRLGPLTFRILIEIDEQALDEATSVADGILAVLTGAGLRKPVLLHGFDATVWPFVECAARQRFSTRVGLEDGSRLPDNTIAPSNAALVAAAVAMTHRAS
ncbi:MAG TPA: 3-keto-5-aminohexanoate cleavage protein [Geminicoccus sp.]|jgi:uncharacterized protein (DUF849 family)|uniref:3-keto-5-aminohexanoate cleavage protein n=1 Tax=Geminicoccus sp. TaxID=2024832 RepID=UPI002E349955|nr:3-keto-5-aminohexanoate cleavage protein [Geminicoccus sp.]HEX2528638.1 3-keto-5-aminohexanoate cleavage protein [Geminicoccus sp.]